MRQIVQVAVLSRRPSQGGISSTQALDALRADTEPWVARAAAGGARVLCLTEAYPELAERAPLGGNLPVEPADGGSLHLAADLAQRYGIDLVWPRNERDELGKRNVCLYIDRHGELLGRYVKMFPTIGEMDEGTVPGDQAVVVETDYGLVGFAICFDLNFSEVREAYRALQPDLIYFASAYPGGLKVNYWAVEIGCFMVASVRNMLGQIVDRRGYCLERPDQEPYIAATVNLNSVQLHQDDNRQKMDAMLAKYGAQVRFDMALQEGRFQISSTGPDIDDLIEEFELVRLEDYWAASRAARQARLP